MSRHFSASQPLTLTVSREHRRLLQQQEQHDAEAEATRRLDEQQHSQQRQVIQQREADKREQRERQQQRQAQLAEVLRMEAEERVEVARMEELLRMQEIREAKELMANEEVQASLSAHRRSHWCTHWTSRLLHSCWFVSHLLSVLGRFDCV